MKILMVSSYLPYPLFSGGSIRLFNIIKELSKKHEITLVCEKRPYQTEDDIDAVAKYCEHILTFDRKKQWSMVHILQAGFSLNPFLIVGHTNSKMKQKIKELLERRVFDFIHIETFYVMQNLPSVSIPVVLVEHNIEYMVYRRFIDQSALLLKPLLYLDVAKIKFHEERFWKKATKVVVVSDAEKKYITKKDSVAVVPNGVDIDYFKMNPFGRLQSTSIRGKQRKVLFIGDFKWIQNVDAIGFLLQKIWPKVLSEIEGKDQPLLWVVGRKIPRQLKNTRLKQVVFDENASVETREIFKQADVLIAPIRVGGGTSFKILEAMASGVPVVTTKLGIEGIDAIHNQEVIIGESSEELAKEITSILNNTSLYQKIAKNARKLIEEKYNWKKIVQNLERVYQSVV